MGAYPKASYSWEDRKSTYIELRTTGAPRAVEGNHLRAKEVLPVLDALGDVDDLLPLVVDDHVRPPLSPIEALLLDVEPGRSLLAGRPLCALGEKDLPPVSGARVGRGVVDLLQVREHGTLVARVHDVLRTG